MTSKAGLQSQKKSSTMSSFCQADQGIIKAAMMRATKASQYSETPKALQATPET
jgi:hypothetical protein